MSIRGDRATRLVALAAVMAAAPTTRSFAQGHGAHDHGAMAQQPMHISVRQGNDEVVVDYGPMVLPAGSDHHMLAQPSTVAIALPVDGWIRGFSVDIVDSAGTVLPRSLLHHVNVIVPQQRELFSDIMLRLAAAGPETAPLSFPRVIGFRVRPGDSLIVSGMMQNPTSHDYTATIRIRFPFTGKSRFGLGTIDIFPFYLDVMPPNRPHSFDLPPGKSEKYWEGKPAIDGRLLGAGGHMHQYGTLLRLEDRTDNVVLWEAKPVIDSATGEVTAFPVSHFVGLTRFGLHMRPDHVYRLTAFYDNPTGHVIPDGGMGALGGVFMPSDGSKWPAVDRSAADYQSDVRGTFRSGAP